MLPRWSIVLLASAFVPIAQGQMQTIESGVRKLSGVEPTQHISYARIFLDGIFVAPGSPPDTAPLKLETVPILIAECTQNQKGKLRFELHMTYSNIEDTAYYPPWRPMNDRDLFPPHTIKTKFAMDFFGYIHVKPAKREWEWVSNPMGELRYNPPGGSSSNLEEITFYLQYLKALPTLRLSSLDKTADKAAQFAINPLFDAMRKEPLCKASGI